MRTYHVLGTFYSLSYLIFTGALDRRYEEAVLKIKTLTLRKLNSFDKVMQLLSGAAVI